MKVISQYTTPGGVAIEVAAEDLPYAAGLGNLPEQLNTSPGVVLTSAVEFPGRYTRWDLGFCAPPLSMTAHGRQLTLDASGPRGEVLLAACHAALTRCEHARVRAHSLRRMVVEIEPATQAVAEEFRSRQPSIFSALRALTHAFAGPDEPWLGLYGAFGYDLAFQFEPVRQVLPRAPLDRDLVLFLPDEITVVDHQREVARRFHYAFEFDGRATRGLPKVALPPTNDVTQSDSADVRDDHLPGEYAATVRRAREYFARGDLFEAVPGQLFRRKTTQQPSALYRRLLAANPAPYGALLSLGEGEHLVAASPEMYVRISGRRVETCPISGTIARGRDAVEDARQIRELLNSNKDAAELTMCTDVDRNDKARVCVPGSIKVIGRRQIEMYSRLIHTVDHVEGQLRDEMDAFDAFLSHAWAVTVTGAPKAAAMQFIEEHERSPRRWYGGALGGVMFNGNMNTGLTLRTIRLHNGVAEVRAGATLLFDSDPRAEEAETRLKASALLAVLDETASAPAMGRAAKPPGLCACARLRRILMVDHQDSFVFSLGGYFRETGASLITMRAPYAREYLARVAAHERPDLVVLSPGPGNPQAFGLRKTIAACLALDIPVFGVCLGLQGIVEYFGGTLGQLPIPVHGKPGRVRTQGGKLFDGLPATFEAGRYHSLYAREVPAVLAVTATAQDDIVMAVEHRNLPVAGVQFHPESIMTLEGGCGRALIRNVVERLH
ncbi:MAG: anthranilate synthase component I [Gammaproteobacteria bacterium]|nr:anthranilate synthase component I [Gammaproteobacteria bacterium]